MTIEVTAKKVDDAIKQGLEQLGATLDDVKVEVVDAGGFLRKAKVRLTLEEQEDKKPAPEAKKPEPQKAAETVEKKPEKPEPQKPATPVEKKPEQKPAESKPQAKPEAKKQQAKPAAKPAQAKPEAKVKNEQAPAGEEKSENPQDDLPSAQQESRSQKPKKSAKKPQSEKPQEAEDLTDETSDEEKSQALETGDQSKKAKRRLRAEDREAASHALEFVKKTVELMGFDTATVSADDTPEHVEITAPEGDDSLLIGRHGETLSALTYLAETCARAEKCHVNIVVDCNGYRARRAASLTSMAKRRARESASKHRKIKLEPMDRTDRRTIHCALADDEYVTTASEGKEPYRYVVITPKDGVVYDYDDKKHDRRDRGRDRNGKGGRGGHGGAPKIETTPMGAKPRFDINLHGFVGHNDPVPEEDVKPEEAVDTTSEE